MDAEQMDGQGVKNAKGKLAGEGLDARLRELVELGLSLAEIRVELGVDVSRQALHKRIGELGLVLQRRPFGAAKLTPVLGRRVSRADMAKYVRPTRERDGPWLDAFGQELDELLSTGAMSYAEVWDELKRRHPFVPQLAAQTASREKSLRISVWVARRRVKNQKGQSK
jgi:hypothetical protein